ncbi:hypothetical protein, partial [Paraburkholderia oxyphila]|uniref:hypothetical protein n=1 Tax=Paraburkholderia oxyphila TaxID=614212 RepID=UPI00047FBC75
HRTLDNGSYIVDNQTDSPVTRQDQLDSINPTAPEQMTTGVMQSNPDPHSGNADRFSVVHFVWWTGFLLLCLVLWEFDKAVFGIFIVSVFLFPPLAIAWLVGTIGNTIRRRWRRAASALLGPPLAGALIVGLSSIGWDPDRVHFLLVKYPHEIEVHFSTSGEKAVHNWSWGLDAAPLSPGVAYTLTYDPTDAALHAGEGPDKSIRPMGDHFYIVKESEDGSPL